MTKTHHFGKVLKTIRRNAGLTQSELSEIIESSPSHVGMLEQGRSMPSYETLEKLVNEFKIDANVFFEQDRDSNKDLGELIDIFSCMNLDQRHQLILFLKSIQNVHDGLRNLE